MQKYTFKYKDKEGQEVSYSTTDHIKAMGTAAAFVTNCAFSLEIDEYQIEPTQNEQ